MSILPRVLPSTLVATLILTLIVTQAAGAADPTLAAAGPTQDSIKELLTITESRKLVDGVPGQVESAMQESMQDAFDGEPPTPAQQKVLTEMGAKATALFKAEMGWGVLEPLFIEVYSKTFTQSEVDGMIAFYKTEPGRAVIAKMPLVMQNTMELMQERMMALGPRLQQLQEEAIEQLQPTEKEDAAQAK